MSVDWNKPLEIRSNDNDNDVRTNCHYVGFDANRPDCPRVISYLRNEVGAWIINVPDSGEHHRFRVINVPEPPAWMAKAVDEICEPRAVAIELSELKNKVLQILTKHAKESK